MSDTKPEETVPEQEKSTGCGKKIGLGCGAILLFLVFLFMLMHNSAVKTLDARVKKLKREIADHRKQDFSRAVLFGKARKGNAVWDYNALEWMMDTRKQWDTQKPANLPKTKYPKNYFESLKVPAYLHAAHLINSLEHDTESQSEWSAEQARIKKRPMKKAQTKKQAQLTKAIAFHNKYGKDITRHIKEGLKRQNCDWQFEWEKGSSATIPNLMAQRTAASFMAYEAQLSPPSEGLRLSLQILAFGKDLERQPTMIGGMIAIAVQAIGYQSVERALRRPLKRADYQLCIEVLNKLGHARGEAMVVSEQQSWEVTFASLAGYSLQPGRGMRDAPNEQALRDFPTAMQYLKFKVAVNREWNQYSYYYGRFLKISQLALDKQEAAFHEVQTELQESYTLIAKAVIPNLFEAFKHVREGNILRDLNLLGAAAHLYRKENGGWPKKTEALKAYLEGKVPMDLYTDGKTEYILTDKGLDLCLSSSKPPYDGRTLIIRVRATK
jgi:hypothetical protein